MLGVLGMIFTATSELSVSDSMLLLLHFRKHFVVFLFCISHSPCSTLLPFFLYSFLSHFQIFLCLFPSLFIISLSLFSHFYVSLFLYFIFCSLVLPLSPFFLISVICKPFFFFSLSITWIFVICTWSDQLTTAGGGGAHPPPQTPEAKQAVDTWTL